MNTDNEILVSVIITCYNHEKYIGDCLQSIIEQTYKNIEIIICDDYSCDHSVKVIETFMHKLKDRFSQTKYILHHENLGLTTTLNEALKKSDGKYIKFLSGDDMLSSDYVRKCVNCFSENIEIDGIVTNGIVVNEQTRYGDIVSQKTFYDTAPDFSRKNLFSNLYINNYIFAPGLMVNRRVYDMYGTYDEEIAIEDWEFNLRLAHNNAYIYYLDENLVFYRKSENGMTSLQAGEMLGRRRKLIHEAEIKIVDKYGKFVDKKTYANRKLDLVYGELMLRKQLELENNEEVWTELKHFHMWRYIRIRKAIWILRDLQQIKRQ